MHLLDAHPHRDRTTACPPKAYRNRAITERLTGSMPAVLRRNPQLFLKTGIFAGTRNTLSDKCQDIVDRKMCHDIGDTHSIGL